MTIKDIQMQADPVRKAAMLHVRFWQTPAWEKARAMRDNLIDEYDPEWPHNRFWDAVNEIHLCKHWKVNWLQCWADNPAQHKGGKENDLSLSRGNVPTLRQDTPAQLQPGQLHDCYREPGAIYVIGWL